MFLDKDTGFITEWSKINYLHKGFSTRLSEKY